MLSGYQERKDNRGDMLGVYLSGTGNTKHCITKFLDMIDPGSEVIALSVSDEDSIVRRIEEHEMVVLAYPTQFSNTPYMIRDFIRRYSGLWSGKQVFCLTTMGAFSGDGTEIMVLSENNRLFQKAEDK